MRIAQAVVAKVVIADFSYYGRTTLHSQRQWQDLAIQEPINLLKGSKMMTPFGKYLNPRLISFIDIDTRDKAIRTLVNEAYKAGKVKSPDDFFKAVINRENIVTTGIGMGVAIPHAKLEGFQDFFIAIGILDKGIDWKALDGAPVRLIFLIGGPDDKQTEYLRILSSLTLTLKDEAKEKRC